jgi:CPA2 family monovalent cation:H+ antiporter-2
MNLILAGALLSITLNPLVFSAADHAISRLQRSPRLKRRFEDSRAKRFGLLQEELEAARRQAEQRMATHKTFTPEELVESFPLFAGLTPEQRDVLLLHFEPRTAQPGERVIRAGDAADAVYFISQGEVQVSVAGKRIKLKAGDFFGEMALLSSEARTADVTAVDYSKFATLDRHDFGKFLRKYPGIREQVAVLANQRAEMNRQFLKTPADQTKLTGQL